MLYRCKYHQCSIVGTVQVSVYGDPAVGVVTLPLMVPDLILCREMNTGNMATHGSSWCGDEGVWTVV